MYSPCWLATLSHPIPSLPSIYPPVPSIPPSRLLPATLLHSPPLPPHDSGSSRSRSQALEIPPLWLSLPLDDLLSEEKESAEPQLNWLKLLSTLSLTQSCLKTAFRYYSLLGYLLHPDAEPQAMQMNLFVQFTKRAGKRPCPPSS